MSLNTHTRMLIVLIIIHLSCISSESESIECIPSEREALLRFKQHLNDPSNRLVSWNAFNPNCCYWNYVVCSNVTFHVLQLHLNTSLDAFVTAFNSFMFSGEINDSLIELKHLNYLNLSGNRLTGNISNALGNLTSLVILDLSYNEFQGAIPTSLGNLTSLLGLDISGNELEGVIPTSLGNLTSLMSLDISGNQFEGGIPTSFRKLCNLRDISFSNLNCNQTLDEILEILIPCASHELKSLVAYGSNFSGHLTNQLGMFKNLETLDLLGNSITGEIPQSLGNLSSLREIFLSYNQLSGNPFKILRLFPKLSSLHIDDNLFQGIVQEDDLANFTALEALSASGNNFTLKVQPNWQPKFQLFSLQMNSWKLGPSFPSWIRLQKNLRDLDMSNVGISNSIPTWFWERAPEVYLNLSHNHIHGTLPNESTIPIFLGTMIVDLSSNNLQGNLPFVGAKVISLDLSYNSFSGSITDFLCKKSVNENELQILNLASNNLSEEIPECWRMWPELVEVNLESNYFIGSLPSSMGSLSKLQYLRMNNNTLSGEFPIISLNGNRKLISLDLGENNLTGDIPGWVRERLPNLKFLRLRSNHFSGNIPHTLCDMKFLQNLDLALNKLSGNIPNCLNNLSAMINKTSERQFVQARVEGPVISMDLWVKGRNAEYGNILGFVKNIDLSANELSGGIPIEITDLSGLIYLNLSKNNLIGHIPERIGNMESLESIDLSRNQLSGGIPSSIANLSFLNKLDLSYNHLEGKIPTGTQLQGFEASSFVGNNLCGPPLLLNCTMEGEVPNDDANDKERKNHGVKWLFVSVAFGFIVGFWGFVGPLFIFKSWRYAYYRFLDDMWYKLQSCM